MSDQSLNTISEDEINLKQIIDFFIESWKIMVLTGLLGIIGSTVYLWLTPNQYQATAQIKMAQIVFKSNNNNMGVNVEDSNLLVARFSSPSAYPGKVIKDCGFEDIGNSPGALAASVKLSHVKGVESLVELKVNLESKQKVKDCAESLFDHIKISQHEIIKPFVDDAISLLRKYQDRLGYIQSQVNKSGSTLSVASLLSIDEVRFLQEEIVSLNTFIARVNNTQTKLISPIYVFDNPVSPNKRKALMAGLFGGLFLGLLLMLCKRVFVFYKIATPKS